jgi:hypothetical protein
MIDNEMYPMFVALIFHAQPITRTVDIIHPFDRSSKYSVMAKANIVSSTAVKTA